MPRSSVDIVPLGALREAALHCRECPLGARATQTVWGEGSARTPLMLVGEQPGDREDLVGRPFVGPAGRLLDRALQALGWRREDLYVTNAVKHFKYELRGKRRMHKTPGQLEILACHHWLESEIAAVRPAGIVALGATAARAVLGHPARVLAERGTWQRREDGVRVLVTLHPSALLRGDPEQREVAFAAWLRDLEHASELLPARLDAVPPSAAPGHRRGAAAR
ncbi:MAG: UdgX family uracil-DNA binding protein [Burkholderiaceae bacterium]